MWQHFVSGRRRPRHTDPQLITRFDKSKQELRPPRTGRITEVTSAFSGVSLPQETASETLASISCQSAHTHLSQQRATLRTSNSAPGPRLYICSANLQSTALLGGNVVGLHPPREERCSCPPVVFLKAACALRLRVKIRASW